MQLFTSHLTRYELALVPVVDLAFFSLGGGKPTVKGAPSIANAGATINTVSEKRTTAFCT